MLDTTLVLSVTFRLFGSFEAVCWLIRVSLGVSLLYRVEGFITEIFI